MAGTPKTYEADPASIICMIIELPNGNQQDHDIDITNPARTVSQEVRNLHGRFGHHGLPGTANDMVMVLFSADHTHNILPNNDSLGSHRDDLNEAEYLKIMHRQTAAQLQNQPQNLEALGAKAK